MATCQHPYDRNEAAPAGLQCQVDPLLVRFSPTAEVCNCELDQFVAQTIYRAMFSNALFGYLVPQIIRCQASCTFAKPWTFQRSWSFVRPVLLWDAFKP